MPYIVYFIKSHDRNDSQQKWSKIAQKFLKESNITAAHLYNVEHPAIPGADNAYQMVGVFECKNTALYSTVMQRVDNQSMIEDFEMEGALTLGKPTFCNINTAVNDARLGPTQNILIINPMKVPLEMKDDCHKMWERHTENFSKQPAFANVLYLEATADSPSGNLWVNFAQWKSEEGFREAYNNPAYKEEHTKAAAPFFPYMQPSICKHVSTIGKSLELQRENTGEDIVVNTHNVSVKLPANENDNNINDRDNRDNVNNLSLKARL